MQSTNWPPAHSEALREHLARGMSYSEIAAAINDRFQTAYSRNATIGRAKRMGLAGSRSEGNGSEPSPKLSIKARQPSLCKLRQRRLPQRRLPEMWWPIPKFKRTETAKLRCAEVDPRHLSLIDLEPSDCRYPYGGEEEGEAITFCGHTRREGSSYCAAHFKLTRGPKLTCDPIAASERAAETMRPDLVEAA